ncbi:DUF5615 family PIN-like protein [Candidatus Daviesbacteria bacterium]|nr:DUF5615 family PIN-like protein [Candidatus Daviesbacteria bacterium]
MKFITDENLGIQIPKYLKDLGLDVISAIEVALNKPDSDILDIANKENRILLTMDKDFGELVFKEKLVHFGVILLRLKDESVENKKKVLLRAIKSGKNFKRKFTRIRD